MSVTGPFDSAPAEGCWSIFKPGRSQVLLPLQALACNPLSEPVVLKGSYFHSTRRDSAQLKRRWCSPQ